MSSVPVAEVSTREISQGFPFQLNAVPVVARFLFRCPNSPDHQPQSIILRSRSRVHRLHQLAKINHHCLPLDFSLSSTFPHPITSLIGSPPPSISTSPFAPQSISNSFSSKSECASSIENSSSSFSPSIFLLITPPSRTTKP